MIPVKITTGRYLPETVVKNEDFIKEFGDNISAQALERLLGTKEHRVAAEDEQPSDLLVKAAENIIQKSGVDRKDITRIIVSTSPGDVIEPATAAIVQKKLGIGQAGGCSVLDIKASCIGWLDGVNLASSLINSSSKQEKILVLAGTLGSRTASFHIVQHRAIFGDGAGGILLETPQYNGNAYRSIIYASEFWGLGKYSDIIHWPAPWSIHFEKVPKEFKGFFYMGEKYPQEPKLLFRLAEIYLPRFIDALWQKTGFSVNDIDFAIVHQPSKPLFEKALECLEIPVEKTAYNFDRYGNTVSAELPITLDEAVGQGKIKKGDLVLLITFGAGITLGAMLMRY